MVRRMITKVTTTCINNILILTSCCSLMHLVLTAADAAAAVVGHNLMLASGHHHPPADLMLPPPSHKMENIFSHFIKPIQDHAKVWCVPILQCLSQYQRWYHTDDWSWLLPFWINWQLEEASLSDINRRWNLFALNLWSAFLVFMSPGLYVASGFGSSRWKPQILACREVNKSEMVMNNKSESREEQITRCGLSVGGV